MNNVIIYHAISKGVACDDGFGAAWVANRYLPGASDNIFIEGIYGKEPQYDLIQPEDTVYILDFSYPVSVLNVIAARAKEVILLDHHKSAMDRWEVEKGQYAYNKRDTIHFDMNHSGAMLAWNYFNKNNANPPLTPKLIAYVEDNDLWRHKLPNCKEFIEALRSYPQTTAEWDRIADRTDFNLGGFVGEGKIINRYYQQKLQEVIATSAEPCQILEHSGLCCNAPKMFASDIGHILATKSGTFGATWFKKADGTVEWSLRCNDGFDVAAIAKQFGGGGHTKAAGFSLHPNDLNELSNGIKLWNTEKG